MRFTTKLILVCEAIFILLTIVIGAFIGVSTYEKTKQIAFDGYLYEADNIVSSISLYLANSRQNQKVLSNYADSLVDIFSKENIYLEFYDKNGKFLAGNLLNRPSENREEIKTALKNKGQQIFISRYTADGRYLAFFAQYISKENDGILVVVVKNLSGLSEQKTSILKLVSQGLVIGVMIVAVVVGLATNRLLKPVKNLMRASKRIARGRYSERVVIHGNDEFAHLAESFNIMANAVEDNIAELEERNEIQQTMMDNLTHELRTPLTSIIGYSELLSSIPYQPEIFIKGLGYINLEGKRMLNLNKTLLDLTYYQHGKIDFEEVSLRPLLSEAKDLIELRAKTKSVKVILEAENFSCEMAPVLIRSLLTNLLDNALKACQAGDTITIIAKKQEDLCLLTIQDTGKGMTQESLNHIMEPFYQVQRARNSNDPFAGLGLGLTIVQKIVQKHHGTLDVDSVLNEGTIVRVAMPIHQSKEL